MIFDRCLRTSILLLCCSLCLVACQEKEAKFDPTLPSYISRVVVPGSVCPAPNVDDLSSVKLSVIFESAEGFSATPDFIFQDSSTPPGIFQDSNTTLGEAMGTERLKFQIEGNPGAGGVPSMSTDIFCDLEPYGDPTPTSCPVDGDICSQNTCLTPISLGVSSVKFWAPGYPSEGDQNTRDAIDAKDKLVVIAMDNSASFAGIDGRKPASQQRQLMGGRSDSGDNRAVFAQDLANKLDPSDFVSVVKINSDIPNIINCCPENGPCSTACSTTELPKLCSQPTKNRSETQCSLDRISRLGGEVGTTPINKTLKDIYYSILLPSSDLNPVVVLFTDGAELDEEIQSLLGPDGAIELYKNGYKNNALTASVPVIVLHLDQTPLAALSEAEGGYGFRAGRDDRLLRLACETGGDYIFLKDADSITNGRTGSLATKVRNLITGSWSVIVDTNLDEKEATSWNVSTDLVLNIDQRGELVATMAKSQYAIGGVIDTRLWFPQLSGGGEPSSEE
jgi:hypothetical protein